MKPREMASLFRNYRHYIFAGLIFLIISQSGWGFGLLTGCMCIWLGTCAGAFESSLKTPGIWRLSTVFLVFGTIGYVTVLLGQFHELLQPAQARDIAVALDASVGSVFAWRHLRFLISLSRYNLALTQSNRLTPVSNDVLWHQALSESARPHWLR
jgi:hypothetical protein